MDTCVWPIKPRSNLIDVVGDRRRGRAFSSQSTRHSNHDHYQHQIAEEFFVVSVLM